MSIGSIKFKKTKARGRSRKQTLSTLSALVSILVLSIAFVIIAFSLLLSAFGMRSMYVVSNSMNPEFEQGDMLIIASNYQAISPGDIVGYEAAWADGKIVTHRVIDVSGDEITVKGDNNVNPDPTFTKDKVRGEIIGQLPNLGWVFNPWGIAILCITGLAFSIIADKTREEGKHAGKHSKKK